MLTWKVSTLLLLTVGGSAAVLAGAVVWSLATDGMFTLKLGRYGAAFVGIYAAGYNLEDDDGGYHGIAFVYFERTYGDMTMSRVIRTHVPPGARDHGASYVGAPSRS
jgi:hypothetical protein